MSVESTSIALHHSRATGTAKVILIGIANHDGDGGAWPSLATLAKYGNCTVRNAQKAVAKLEELGEVRVHQQQGGNSRTPDHVRPNLYEFLLKCSPDCDRTKNHRSRFELPDPLSVATPPVGNDTRPPVGSDTPPPVGSDTRTIHRTTRGKEKSSTVGAREVPPAPRYPKFVPDPPRPTVRPRTEAEAAQVAELEALACSASPTMRHWYPADMTTCARGCGTTITTED